AAGLAPPGLMDQVPCVAHPHQSPLRGGRLYDKVPGEPAAGSRRAVSSPLRCFIVGSFLRLQPLLIGWRAAAAEETAHAFTLLAGKSCLFDKTHGGGKTAGQGRTHCT